jgi:cellulose synthase/poly-beta-1,6-N-acetylglucosamine synthase-like glycosyltransferase
MRLTSHSEFYPYCSALVIIIIIIIIVIVIVIIIIVVIATILQGAFFPRLNLLWRNSIPAEQRPTIEAIDYIQIRVQFHSTHLPNESNL